MTIINKLGLSTIHLKNGNFGEAFKTFFMKPSTFNRVDSIAGYDYDDVNISVRSVAEVEHAYYRCPPLAAIIDKKAQNFILGKTWILDSDDKVVTTAKAQKINKLLLRPNKNQTKSEWEADLHRYTQLFGYCFVYAIKPYGYGFDSSSELYVINPSSITEIVTKSNTVFRGFLDEVDFIKIRSKGSEFDTLKIDADSLYLFKDLRPTFGESMLPVSRAFSLEMPINNIIGAYDSRNTLVNSRGSLGMITNQTADSTSFQPLKTSEKQDLLKDYKRMKGTRKGQSHIIISSSNLKWQSMVLPTKDLMLFEEVEDSINRLCDAYSFPAALYAKLNSDGSNSAMQTSTRNLFQEAIIPESISLYEQMSNMFELHKQGHRFDKDYSHVAAMQVDAEKSAQARLRRNQAAQIEFKNNVLNLNSWRKLNGDDPLPGGEVYYSDIKDLITVSYKQNDSTLESTYVEDDLNPRQNSGDASNIQNDNTGDT